MPKKRSKVLCVKKNEKLGQKQINGKLKLKNCAKNQLTTGVKIKMQNWAEIFITKMEPTNTKKI